MKQVVFRLLKLNWPWLLDTARRRSQTSQRWCNIWSELMVSDIDPLPYEPFCSWLYEFLWFVFKTTERGEWLHRFALARLMDLFPEGVVISFQEAA